MTADPERDRSEEGRLERALRKGLRGKALPEEVVEKAMRLREDWGLVAHPEGTAPYFEREGEVRPEFDPAAKEFQVENAWWLSELCRVVYLPADGEKDTGRGDAGTRFDGLLAGGFREVASFRRRSNHAVILDYEAGDGGTVVCFRGTMSTKQWLLNLSTIPVPWSEGCYVHQGFKILFEEIWSRMEEVLDGAKRPFVFTGHSLGGALATLAAMRIAPDVLYTFGAPRTGNAGVRDALGELPVFRVVKGVDIVPSLPHSVETFAPYDFQHAGVLHYLAGGEMLVDPSREQIQVESELAEREPLGFLLESFKGAEPPAALVDHAPVSYSMALERLLVEESGG